jgi:hypothetical protein
VVSLPKTFRSCWDILNDEFLCSIPRRAFSPDQLTVPLIALAVYAVQEGTVHAMFPMLSSLAINGTQSPPVFLSTAQYFTMSFNYQTAARLRAVTQTAVVTGATSINFTGAAYTDDTAKLWILRAPVPGFQVELVFTTMDTQPGGDFVTVYNGDSGSLLSSVLRVAGSPTPLPTATTTNTTMVVLFASDGAVSNAQGLQGFAADFSFVTRVNQMGNISCTGACYAANIRYKW